MRYLDLFSGIGGFTLGIQQAYEKLSNEVEFRGCGQEKDNLETTMPLSISQPNKRQYPTCIGYSEIDKYAIQIYEKHFNHKNYGDITTIIPNELPDFDLLVGGFPCQAFSIAGKRGGFDDTRGTLFFDIARICADKRPKDILLENVKGLLSHNGGRTFQTIIGVLTDLGYFVEWQVLNSKNFGVPQNRERVFIRGHLGGEPRRKVFPIGEDDEVSDRENEPRERRTQAKHSTTVREGMGGKADSTFVKGIKVEGYLSGEKWNRFHESSRRVYDKKGISPAIPTSAGGGHMPKLKETRAVLTPDRPTKRQNGRRMKDNGEPSFTLTSQDKHGVYDGMKIRRLTPTECERLQGFPDGWTEGLSDTQRYKTLGNAVTVNVIREIILKL